ncbi:hypothetical protein [Lysinibacillus boronitolerans]|uniref:Uncharacterized protein n=1 Tax=Lysinibacillus boronitolerans JCM 21713 = 10a = NBRC 103108 TaxID=1294264 RepID=A0ABR4XX52_9BACI|nr:hypothetical protein [Lysinibacillus boronitolerans]KGR83643.1 hypothetical protein CD31_15630 [Lysinibacillus boronitolerans JCM 21713 = 10a = NBRC 103108]
MTEHNFIPYLTRLQYKNLNKINKETNMYNIQNMIWDAKIYADNTKFIQDIFIAKTYKIQRLTLTNYKHYFILEQKPDEYKPLLFWVNTLNISNPEPQNIQKIMTYRMVPNDIHLVSLNNERYITIHVGNMLFDYAKIKSLPMNKRTEEELFLDFEKYLNGDASQLEFKYSIFNKTCIIYRVIRI